MRICSGRGDLEHQATQFVPHQCKLRKENNSYTYTKFVDGILKGAISRISVLRGKRSRCIEIRENPRREQFSTVSKLTLCLLLCSLSNWLKKLVPLSQPIRCTTKINCDLFARVLRRLTQITCICFILCFVFVVIGHNNDFGFDSTTLVWKPLY